MLRKFFSRDKNYILEEAQLSLEEPLLHYLVDFVKVEYLLRCNPLGIDDDTARKVESHNSDDYKQLHEFYVTLAGLYRFMFYGDNQLSFIFDGRDDFAIYKEQWDTTFRRWVKDFCKHESFIRSVLELSVFYPEDYTPQMVGLRMNIFITRLFDIKVDPQKGFVRNKVA